MGTWAEPIGHIVRNHNKALDKNEGEPTACPQQAVALGAGPLWGGERSAARVRAGHRKARVRDALGHCHMLPAAGPRRKARHLLRACARGREGSRRRHSDDGRHFHH